MRTWEDDEQYDDLDAESDPDVWTKRKPAALDCKHLGGTAPCEHTVYPLGQAASAESMAGPFAVTDEGTFYETGDDEDKRIDEMARALGY